VLAGGLGELEKIHSPHRVSNPRPSGLHHSASTCPNNVNAQGVKARTLPHRPIYRGSAIDTGPWPSVCVGGDDNCTLIRLTNHNK
jgi:hypothetical protein